MCLHVVNLWGELKPDGLSSALLTTKLLTNWAKDAVESH